ncbi:MAG: hypothetical protein KC912_17725 [Proteobacteria bacterium]|nr:hypothetical protein [Pseudomonadota bacterium]
MFRKLWLLGLVGGSGCWAPDCAEPQWEAVGIEPELAEFVEVRVHARGHDTRLVLYETVEPCPSKTACEEYEKVEIAVMEEEERGWLKLSFEPRPMHAYALVYERRCQHRGNPVDERRTLFEGYRGYGLGPVEPSDQLIGRVFASPGDSQNSMVDMAWLPFLAVTGVDEEAGQIHLELIPPDPSEETPTQQTCASTTSLVADFENPFVRLGPLDLEVIGGEGVVTVLDFTLDATFDPQGQWLTHATFSGVFDLRDFMVGDLDWACELIGSVGTDCHACPDERPWCFTYEAEDQTATWTEMGWQPAANVCGLDGSQRVWVDELETIFAYWPGEASLSAVSYSGDPLWTTSTERPIVGLSHVEAADGERLDLLALHGGDPTSDPTEMWVTQIDRSTGEILEFRSFDDSDEFVPRFGMDPSSPDWVGGFGCAVFPLGVSGWVLGLVAIGVRRQR